MAPGLLDFSFFETPPPRHIKQQVEEPSSPPNAAHGSAGQIHEPRVNVPLTPRDNADLETISTSLPHERRFKFAIEELVGRAVQLGWPESVTAMSQSPILAFFVMLHEDLLKRGCAAANADLAHKTMVTIFATALATWLGDCVTSSDDLARAVDSIVHKASLRHNMSQASDLREALRSLITNAQLPLHAHGIEYRPIIDSPTLPTNLAGDVLSPGAPQAETSAAVVERTMEVNDDQETPKHTTESLTGIHSTNSGTQERGLNESAIQRRPGPKYETARQLFSYYSKKAKKSYLGARYSTEKHSAKAETKKEWRTLPLATRHHWEDLHARFVEDESSLQDLSHLFREGRPRSPTGQRPPSDEGYMSAHLSGGNSLLRTHVREAKKVRAAYPRV